nr:MAG TPA: Repressor protein CI [Caudoviricetes sp.]
MLSHRLKELRLSRQLSQVAIAEKLGISNGLYNKYEKKGVNPPYDTLQKLSKIYGVSIDYILGNDTVPNGSEASPTQIGFSRNLKELRKQKGVTQQQLADILCVDKTSISKWENGSNYPNQNIQVMIADYFGVSVDYLLGRDTPTTKSIDDKIFDDFIKSLGISKADLVRLTKEQLSVIRTTLSALLDSFKKSNK